MRWDADQGLYARETLMLDTVGGFSSFETWISQELWITFGLCRRKGFSANASLSSLCGLTPLLSCKARAMDSLRM